MSASPNKWREERDVQAAEKASAALANAIKFESLTEFVQAPKGGSQIRGLDQGRAILIAFGPPKGGKTFTICDLAMHAAHGLDWHGFKVPQPLRVAYLAGEGTRGLRVRLRAWLMHYDSIETSGNFIVLPRALSLPDRVPDVIEALREFRPHIVVADTLNAFFGSGSENDTEAMTGFVSAVRKLRDDLGCSVYVIHHTGHGDQTRERGSIVLRASADVLVHIAKDSNGSGNVAFQVIDARDMEPMDAPLALRLRQVETDWKDEAGDPLVSCVVEGAGVPVELPGRQARPLGEAQQQILQIIREMSAAARGTSREQPLLTRADVTKRAEGAGIDRRRVSQAWAPLENRGLIKRLEPGTVKLVQS